jgi:hypothetical protein
MRNEKRATGGRSEESSAFEVLGSEWSASERSGKGGTSGKGEMGERSEKSSEF